jgi:hypothetical protein
VNLGEHFQVDSIQVPPRGAVQLPAELPFHLAEFGACRVTAALAVEVKDSPLDLLHPRGVHAETMGTLRPVEASQGKVREGGRQSVLDLPVVLEGGAEKGRCVLAGRLGMSMKMGWMPSWRAAAPSGVREVVE